MAALIPDMRSVVFATIKYQCIIRYIQDWCYHLQVDEALLNASKIIFFLFDIFEKSFKYIDVF